MLEQKLAEVKASQRKKFINLSIGFVVTILVCSAIFIIVSYFQAQPEVAKSISPSPVKEIEETTAQAGLGKSPSRSLDALQAMDDEGLRQRYIDILNDFEKTIKPQLNKIDLNKRDKSRLNHLAMLEEQALAKFSIADYAQALNYIEELKQLAEAIIFASEKQFEEAFSNAQEAFNADNYDDARFFIDNALMLNNQSEDAVHLSNKIDDLSEILPLLRKVNIVRVENNHEKELKLIKHILKLNPKRESSIGRRHELEGIINRKNFKSYVIQSYKAIEKANVKKAKQSLRKAGNIYPNRPEITDITIALQALEKDQNFKKYQQAAQAAITSDDWETAKQQLELALQERANDKLIQESLADATMIVFLQNDLDKHIANPYRLSNKPVLSTAKSKISKAKPFIDMSLSLKNKIETLSGLIESMNKKINVEILSDNQTNIIVRRVGVVGRIQSKTIQLAPGHYKFEGKREGFKSKLIDVFISHEETDHQLSIICDESI